MLKFRNAFALLVLAGLLIPAIAQDKPPATKADDKAKTKADDKAKTDDKDKTEDKPKTDDKAKADDKPKADDKEPVLTWKFDVGKTYYQKMTSTTDQKMVIMGEEIKQKQEQTFVFSLTPKEFDKKDNLWVIEQEIVAVKLKVEMGKSKIDYDSTNPGPVNPLSDFFKALIGSKFKLKLDKDLKVVKVEGRDEFVKKLKIATPLMGQLLEQILTEEAIKEMANPSFAVLPTGDKKPGDTWKSESKLDIGPIGKYDTTYEYTYRGKDSKDPKLDKIEVKTDLKYSAPAGAQAAQILPFTIKGARLTSKDATGTIKVNSAKGRVEESELSLKLEGELDVEIGNQTTKVTLSQVQTTTVTTSDTDPVPSKKVS